jgi:hypothetical protein
MTARDDLVTQVEQAIRDVPPLAGAPDLLGMANAAVDAVAIYVYTQLASGG